MVYLTRLEHFNAAHKLYNPTWSKEKNEEIFGVCANENWHGHNFELYITIKGNIDTETGFLFDVKKLSRLIQERVIRKLDHKNLNMDVDFLQGKMCSTENLKHITPAAMGFVIKSQHHGEKMYAGQLIEYTVKPIFGIPMYWMTEITHVEELKYFVDEQRFGPYSLWHHQHHFKEVAPGTEMTDIVHYKVPYSFLGDIANALVVKQELKKIFDYRYRIIEHRFGKSR